MAKKKNKRKSMSDGVGAVVQESVSGLKHLTPPSGTSIFKEEEDTTYELDHIPYEVKDPKKHPDSKKIPDDIWWRYPYLIHRGVGPNKEDIICPRTRGKACPVCEDGDAVLEDPNRKNKEAGPYRPSKRRMYVVIPRNHNKYKEIPHLWDISEYAYERQLNKDLDFGKDEYKRFADLEGGYTVTARFVGQSVGDGGNTFPACDRVDFKPRDDFDDEILEKAPCLDKCITVPSYEEVQRVYLGLDDTPETSGEEESPDHADAQEAKEEKEEKESKPQKSGGKSKNAEKPKKEEKEESKEKEESILDGLEDWGDITDLKSKDVKKAAKELDLSTKGDIDEIREKIADKLDIDVPEAEGEEEGESEEAGEGECPHGYRFGQDHEEYDECDDCDKWKACLDASED